jgi:hypothetical protein
VEAGLTMEVGRRWGGGKRPARRHSGGGRLRRGGGILRAILWLEMEVREELRARRQSGEENMARGRENRPAAVAAPLLQEKNQIPSKEDHKFEVHSKRKFRLVSR